MREKLALSPAIFCLWPFSPWPLWSHVASVDATWPQNTRSVLLSRRLVKLLLHIYQHWPQSCGSSSSRRGHCSFWTAVSHVAPGEIYPIFYIFFQFKCDVQAWLLNRNSTQFLFSHMMSRGSPCFILSFPKFHTQQYFHKYNTLLLVIKLTV